MQEHLRFIAALRQRDGAEAARLLTEHIDSARSRVMNAAPEPVAREPAPLTAINQRKSS